MSRSRKRRILVAATVATVILVATVRLRQPPSPILPAGPLIGRYDHVAVWTGSRMLIVGGCDGVTPARGAAAFDPASGQWSSLAEPPVALGAASGVWINGSLYATSGDCDGSFEPRDAKVYRYDARRSRWSIVWGGHLRTRAVIEGVIDGDLLVRSDALSPDGYLVHASPSVGVLRLPGDRYISLPALPKGLERGRVAIVGDTLVGLDAWGSPPLQRVPVLGPGAKQWRLSRPPREFVASVHAVFGARLVTCWLLDGDDAGRDGCLEFEPAVDRWREIPTGGWSVRDTRAATTKAGLMLWGGRSLGPERNVGGVQRRRETFIAGGVVVDPATGARRVLPSAGLAPRYSPSVLETPHGVIVWGGVGKCRHRKGIFPSRTWTTLCMLSDGAMIDVR